MFPTQNPFAFQKHKSVDGQSSFKGKCFGYPETQSQREPAPGQARPPCPPPPPCTVLIPANPGQLHIPAHRFPEQIPWSRTQALSQLHPTDPRRLRNRQGPKMLPPGAPACGGGESASRLPSRRGWRDQGQSRCALTLEESQHFCFQVGRLRQSPGRSWPPGATAETLRGGHRSALPGRPPALQKGRSVEDSQTHFSALPVPEIGHPGSSRSPMGLGQAAHF